MQKQETKGKGKDDLEVTEEIKDWNKVIALDDSDEIEDWDSSDTEDLDLSKIDTSVRSIPYVPPHPSQSPIKTREMFVYASPKKNTTTPATISLSPAAKTKPALIHTTTINLTIDDDGDTDDEGTWYWRSETGWEKYSPDVNRTIEKAFKNKETKVSVDKQRYISFVDMLQLRFDDIFKTRSRGIQRRVNGKIWVGKPAWLPTRTDSGRIVPHFDDNEPTEALEDIVTPVDAQWYWRTDLGAWEKFSPAVNAVIEEAKKKQKDTVQIDSERAVNLKQFVQYRVDNPSRSRKVKREEIRGTPQAQGAKIIRSPYFNAPAQPKFTSPTKGDLSIVGEWSWLGDDDKWHPYEKSLSDVIERAYVNKTATTVQVDPERFIDLTNMLQRRYDNEDRKRYIIRIISEKQMKNIQQTLTPEQLKRIQQNKEAAQKKLAQKQKEKFEHLMDELDSKEKSETRSINTNTNPSKKSTGGSEDTISAEEEIGADSKDKGKGKGKEEKIKTPKTPQEMLAWRRSQYKCKDNFVIGSDIENWKETLKYRFGATAPNKTPKFTPNNEINKVLSLWKGDITTLEIDAIVNAAKPSLLGGGGIDGAIHKAAGHGLVQECALLGMMNYLVRLILLPAKHVIHTVGPIGEKPKILKSCYKSVLKKAMAKHIKTLAFCCISTGIYGYPNKPAAKVALETVRSFLQKDDNYREFDRIIFCVFMKEDDKIYKHLMFKHYFPPVKKPRSI